MSDPQFESERQEIIDMLGYCPSPTTIVVRLYPKNDNELTEIGESLSSS